MAFSIRSAIVALTLAIALFAAPAQAQPTRQWGQVGSWLISVDPSLANSCYALHDYDDGTVMRFGSDKSSADQRWYILFGNDRWRSIEDGGEYNVTLKFDREPEWTAVATGVDMGADTNFLYVFGSDPGFIDEFVAKNTLVLTYEGTTVTRLSLRGSARAARAMMQCQAEQVSAPPADPFAGKKKKSLSDPFAN